LNADAISINLLAVRGFNESSPLWPVFMTNVESIYNTMSYSHANTVINERLIDDLASDFDAKIKEADKRAKAMETDINKLKQTLSVISETLLKELEQNIGRD
jgi:hypothetical protein